MATILSPFGAAEHQTPAHAVTHAVTISNSNTIFEPDIATANITINLTVGAEVPKGATLLVKVKTTATETTTFGTGITAPVVTGVAGKTWTQGFIYDGTAFVPVGVKQQID